MSQINKHNTSAHRQVGVRALVVNTQHELLLVAHEPPTLWSTPGGHLLNGETLKDAVKRRVYEETGLDVEVDRLVYVDKLFDVERTEHEVEFYFLATVPSNKVVPQWTNGSGSMKCARFFTREEVQGLSTMGSGVLREELW